MQVKTLKDNIQVLLDIVKDADRIKEEVERRSYLNGGSGDLYNAFKYIKADKFDELAQHITQLDNILSYGLEFSNAEYVNMIEIAEQKLDSIPFGSADWQRHYGFIEGLKQVKLYTKTNNESKN